MSYDQKLSPAEMLSYFAVGAPYPNVYILGCFARYVTLYSQQVRALNLVDALLKTDVIKPGSSLVVVGAGAAGLTASAAAALAGVNVTLLEELEGALEFQMNNRQRWLHPRIYDWPESDFDDDRARLPVLDWKAGYAEAVADQILTDWKAVSAHVGDRLCLEAQVSELSVAQNAGRVSWNQPGHAGRQKFHATVIIAAGFGLDGGADGRGSYWTDDDLDNSLRLLTDQKVLVVGHGDGALTDVMRLCFRRFRHSDITKLFRESSEISSVKRDLLEIHNLPANVDFSSNDTAELIHKQFQELRTYGLEKTLEPLIRKNRPTVYLTGRDENYYGPSASILNRLILLLLIRQDRIVVKPIRGPASIKPEPVNGKLRVQLADAAPEYDRVVYRTGPVAALDKFAPIVSQCNNLLGKWKHLNQFNDPTRRESNWEFLKGVWPGPKPSLFELDKAIRQLGISAKFMSVTKEIRNDGSSTVTYSVRDLSVREGEIEGIRCPFIFTAGCIGPPELDAAARQIGATWHTDPPLDAEPVNLSERMEFARRHAREMSGTLRFNSPLTKESAPASFGLRFTVLNGDALSSWEFEQLYPESDRFHVNGREKVSNLEYFARTMLLPVEHLLLRLTLPERIKEAPWVSVFECSKRDKITLGTVAPNNLLQLAPFVDSPVHFSKLEWKRASEPAQIKLSNPTPRTWEASVERPPLGTVYSLDFRVPSVELSGEQDRVAQQAQNFRKKLLDYAAIRKDEKPLDERARRIREEVLKIAAALAFWFALDTEAELFQVTVMTYDQERHRLITVDGAGNGSEPNRTLWDFWLPFGLGIAGACFKQADKPLVYVRPTEGTVRTGPDYYVPPPKGGYGQEVLVSVPIDHPAYKENFEMERSRQCIAVVSFSSDQKATKLQELAEKEEFASKRWAEVVGVCQNFGNKLYEIVCENSGR